MEVFEPEFGVFLLVIGGFKEESGDLLVTFLLGFGGVVGVFVSCLAFTSKSLHEALFGFGSFEFHIFISFRYVNYNLSRFLFIGVIERF